MLQSLKNKFPIKEKNWPQYEACFKRLEIPAKTTVLAEGQVSKKAYFIEKGCMRVWFNNSGKDVTFHFFFEGDRVSSTESFKKNIPSPVSIETIEPCVVWAIDKKDMDAIINQALDDPQLRNRFIDTLYERTFHYIQHSLSFVRDTPTQRYINLLNENPQIVQRVPQHYVASYLGISTVHVSRIKSSLSKKRK
jgi:CRP-like cAMP-binding protein